MITEARIEDLIGRIYSLDPVVQPAESAQATLLLSEVQAWQREGETLSRRVAHILTAAPTILADHNLGDLIGDVLARSEGPMRPSRIANEVRALGYQHSGPTRNPKQLENSVWARLANDARFVKISRGLWDIRGRLDSDPGTRLVGYDIEIETLPCARLRGVTDEAASTVAQLDRHHAISDDVEHDSERGVLKARFRFVEWEKDEAVEGATEAMVSALLASGIARSDDGTCNPVSLSSEPEPILERLRTRS